MNTCPYCGKPIGGGGEQYSECGPCGIIWGAFCTWVEGHRYEEDWQGLAEGVLLIRGEVPEL